MKRILLLLTLAAYLAAPMAVRAVDRPSTAITLAQDDHDHEGPTAGLDERPWVNLAFPAIMIFGGLIYAAVTRRRSRKQ